MALVTAPPVVKPTRPLRRNRSGRSEVEDVRASHAARGVAAGVVQRAPSVQAHGALGCDGMKGVRGWLVWGGMERLFIAS